MDSYGLNVVQSSRTLKNKDNKESNEIANNNVNKIVDTVVDNFGDIIRIANDLVEIRKMKVQSDAILAKMREDRKTLLAEAEAYAKRKNADTTSVVEKMRVIQEMMKDFYKYNNSSMTGEDFSKVITEMVTQIGRIE